MLRLLAFDLDGTLLDSTGALPDRNRLALVAAAERGLDVILVSGRHHLSLQDLHGRIGLPSPAICCNGAYVYDYAASSLLLPTPMPNADARTIVERCRAAGLRFLVYTATGMFHDRRTPTASESGISGYFPAANARLISGVDDVEDVIDREAVFKFVVAAEDAPPLCALREGMADLPDFSIAFSWFNRLDIATRKVSKGDKLLELASRRGIAASEIAAFGDQENDIPMLRAVGWGTAMGNATTAVKAEADLVIGDNDSDSLAATVRELVARYG